MTPEEMQKMDQGMAMLADTMPPHWKRMFDNLVREGFTPEQSMAIVRTYVHGLAGGKLS